MPFGLPPPDPGFEMFAASNGMSQGLRQTEGPQVIPRATLRIGSVQLGAQWRNITSPAASGIAALFVKLRGTRGSTQFEGAALYRIRTDPASPANRTAWEFDGAVRHSFGKFGLRLIAEYAPREFEAGPSLYVEGGPSAAVGKKTTLSASIGRRQRNGPDYTSFNAGVTEFVTPSLSLDARLYSTNHPDRGPRYRSRLILSARLTL